MNQSTITNDQHYLAFPNDTKSEIKKARVQVARAANHELIQLYWWFGKAITKKQEELGWSKSVVEQLANDLQKTFNGRSAEWILCSQYLKYKENLP